jgi:hypothetical protein
MTDLADLDLMDATTPPNPAAKARTCRHPRDRRVLLPIDNITRCGSCGHTFDPAVARRNNRNRNRGRSTSRELAEYLGWQNVEAAGWPWDVQANHGRIQSKRDQTGAGPGRVRRLIEAIGPGDWIRGVYHVEPGRRLTSGSVSVLLREWQGRYGWEVPDGDVTVDIAGNEWLLRLPLPLFAKHAGQEGSR